MIPSLACLYPRNKHSPPNPSSPALLSSPSESDEPDDYLGDTEISDQGSDDLSTKPKRKSPIKRRKKTQSSAERKTTQPTPSPPPPKHYKIYDSQVTDTRINSFEVSNVKVMAGPEYNQLYQNYVNMIKPPTSDNQPENIDEAVKSDETNETDESQDSVVEVLYQKLEDNNKDAAKQNTTEELCALEAIDNALVDDDNETELEKLTDKLSDDEQVTVNETKFEEEKVDEADNRNFSFYSKGIIAPHVESKDTKSDEELNLDGEYRFQAKSYKKDSWSFEETSFAMNTKEEDKLSNDEMLTLADLDNAFAGEIIQRIITRFKLSFLLS